MRHRADEGGGRRRLGDEDGSLVLALLATIVVGGLVTVVVASVIAGQRGVRFDQEFTGQLHVAEAGVEEVVYRLNQQQFDPDVVHTYDGGIGEDPDDKPYGWTATEIGEDEWEVWEVESTGGGAADVQRTIRAIVEDKPLFDLAAFSDLFLGLSGANHADSYNSLHPGDSSYWCTGNGRVGSNDTVEFQGGAQPSITCPYDNANATVDGVDLFEWVGANADSDRCVYTAAPPNNCWHDAGELDPRFFTHEDPVPFIDDVTWMEDALDDCVGGSAWSEEIVTSDLGGVLEPADSSNGHLVDFESILGAGPGETYVYCVGQLIIDVHTELQGATPEDPVVFMVRDGIELKQGKTINCRYDDNGEPCADRGGSFDFREVWPVSAALQIYTPNDENDNVNTGDVIGMRSQSRFGGVALAPKGTCGGVTGGGGGGGQGGAQTHVFGSLICGDMRSAGGWQFHYDDALRGQIRSGEFEITRWAEE